MEENKSIENNGVTIKLFRGEGKININSFSNKINEKKLFFLNIEVVEKSKIKYVCMSSDPFLNLSSFI